MLFFFTGAALPPGADAVVQVENTELVKLDEQTKEEKIVKILAKVEKSHDVRPIGVDIAEGEGVLQKGDVVGAPEIGILAMVDYAQVEVVSFPPLLYFPSFILNFVFLFVFQGFQGPNNLSCVHWR